AEGKLQEQKEARVWRSLGPHFKPDPLTVQLEADAKSGEKSKASELQERLKDSFAGLSPGTSTVTEGDKQRRSEFLIDESKSMESAETATRKASLETQIAAAKALVEDQAAKYERERELFARRAMSQKDSGEVEAALKKARTELAAVQSAQANLGDNKAD